MGVPCLALSRLGTPSERLDLLVELLGVLDPGKLRLGTRSRYHPKPRPWTLPWVGQELTAIPQVRTETRSQRSDQYTDGPNNAQSLMSPRPGEVERDRSPPQLAQGVKSLPTPRTSLVIPPRDTFFFLPSPSGPRVFGPLFRHVRAPTVEVPTYPRPARVESVRVRGSSTPPRTLPSSFGAPSVPSRQNQRPTTAGRVPSDHPKR